MRSITDELTELIEEIGISVTTINEALADDLGMDSTEFADLSVSIKKIYDINIDDNSCKNFSIYELAKYIESSLNTQ